MLTEAPARAQLTTAIRLYSVLHPQLNLFTSYKRDQAVFPLKWLFQLWGTKSVKVAVESMISCHVWRLTRSLGVHPLGPRNWYHHDQEDITGRTSKQRLFKMWYCSIVASLGLSIPLPCSSSSCGRHIHEGSIINQSGFGWLPDGWVIIAIIDTGWYELSYLGLML